MARIAGVNIPDDKKIPYSLCYIYGIGRTVAYRILAEAKVDMNKRARELTVDEVNKLRDIIEKSLTVEGALRKEIMMNIKHLKDAGTYRGTRHAKRLPVRGQRTKTNTRTVRGNVRKTMGSGRRKVEKK
ncbi:MAG: 30S ribosomal protein S13 [Patescibacteria group bacterium]